MRAKRVNSYVYGEAHSLTGQLIGFTCPSEEKENVTKTITESIHNLNLPTTHQSVTTHGSHGGYSRFKIIQHEYVGGGPSEYGGWCFIELLEIINPPDGRHNIVIYEANSDYYNTFYEWETLENASAAFKKHWTDSKNRETFPKLPGFKRMVSCGLLSPWFYAIGDEELIGDYAFPEGLQDDPVFRFGQKFVCLENETPIIKTCMGTRFVEEKDYYNNNKIKHYRIVVWSDGSIWNEDLNEDNRPRPLIADELWITDAMEKFKKFLTGKTNHFEIAFINGQKFIGQITPKKSLAKSVAGDYELRVTLDGAKKPACGWVNNFVPTPETPNIVEKILKDVAAKDKKVNRIEIVKVRSEKSGKKWSGVFYNNP